MTATFFFLGNEQSCLSTIVINDKTDNDWQS
jgi:hypothetical protein